MSVFAHPHTLTCMSLYLKLLKVHYVHFIGMKHIFIYIYVYHTNVFEADNIYKNLLQMSFDIVLLCLYRSGAPPMTLLTAGVLIALPYPQLTATASSVCTIVTDTWSGAHQIKIPASNREKVYFWPYTRHELLLPSISPVRGHRSGFYISIWFCHFNHCHVLFQHIHKYLLLGLPCFIFPGRSILSILLPIYPSSPHARWE